MWSQSIEILNPYEAVMASIQDEEKKPVKKTFWMRFSQIFKKGN